MKITAVDDRLWELIDKDAEAEVLTSGFRFTEGPVWDSRDNSLLFCEPRAHQIDRWSERDGLTVFRENANSPTGLTWDPQGRLLTCEPRTSRDGPVPIARRVSRTNRDGSIEPLATHFEGGRLNGPNDLICCANGDVIFTDPDGALHHGDGSVTPSEVNQNGVYRVNGRDDSLELLTGEIGSPNGLVMREGMRELLVADRGTVKLVDMTTRKVSSFIDRIGLDDVRGGADGMKLDARGNLYTGGGRSGVWIYGPDAKLLGRLETEEGCINLCWGDADWQSLYLVAAPCVYRVRMKVRGQQINPE